MEILKELPNGHILVSAQAKKLNDVGVADTSKIHHSQNHKKQLMLVYIQSRNFSTVVSKVNMGAHGQLQGLGAHWEIWMMQQGGMTNHEALKTATINPAQSLGLDDWIGALEAGKLADLIVMDKNPLENIRNTESISMTMVNGRLYDAETMNEIGNNNRQRGKFFWETRQNADVFSFSSASETTEKAVQCLCNRH